MQLSCAVDARVRLGLVRVGSWWRLAWRTRRMCLLNAGCCTLLHGLWPTLVRTAVAPRLAAG